MGRRAGAVTIRELSRNTASIIDRVREEDAPVIITRQGIPVATIQPLEIDPWARQPRAPILALELKGLAARTRGGTFQLTKTGCRVFEQLCG